ncbi:MAG TPA: PAS domain S-box protein, partial [Gemmata sp.]|nr:PAS domain S-box protein [Gemmata sp.]
MFDFTARGSDGSRFVPLANLGDVWTPEMRWLHILGDLSLWLAFVSIPVVVIYFQRYRRGAQGSRLPMLLVVFFLMCGFGYLLDAFMFQYPLYQLSAVWKAATGTVAWTCVIAIMAIAPRVLQSSPLLGKSQSPIAHSDSELHWLAAPPPRTQVNDYIIGILAAVLALLIRAVIQPIATTDQFYSLSLLAVVFVSWHSGFGPALVTLFASMLGMLYFFIEPRNSFGIKELSNQLATAVFFFCGVFCAALGEAQRRARRGTKEALAAALEQKDALAREIIRRAEAEEAMRESEARFRSMADSVPALIWLSDVDRKRTYLNKTWQDFTGHKPEEDLGDKWVESIHPEDRDRYLNEYVAAFGGGRPFEVEYRLRRGDGAYRWVLARGTPLRSPSGSFAGFVGLCLDVTDRKRADEQLRRSEKELADFFENVNVGLHWVAQDGTILRANRAELEMVGLPKDE